MVDRDDGDDFCFERNLWDLAVIESASKGDKIRNEVVLAVDNLPDWRLLARYLCDVIPPDYIQRRGPLSADDALR